MNNTRRIPWAEITVVLVIVIAIVAVYRELRPKPPEFDPNFPTAGASTAPRPSGPRELTGQVTLKGGAPLPAPAIVYIISAAPRTGLATVGPATWPDCAKHVSTDDQGNFRIPALDPDLTFQVMAAAPGCQPATANKVDPAKGKPLQLGLPPVVAPDAPPDQTLSGRVLDPQGNPLVGAVVEMSGYENAGGGGNYGMFPGIDQESVTDEKGMFLLTDKTPFASMLVKVSARGYAEKSFDRLTSGTPHDLTLTPGAELRGRVVLNGRALAKVSVGISGANRGMDAFLGHFAIGTDSKGNFDFLNLPPDGDFQIYTEMTSMKGRGAAVPRPVHTGKDGEATEAGDLVVGPAYRVAGNVVLADGRPVPAKTRLYLGRYTGWDSQQINVGANGAFDFKGVPAEIMSLSVRVNGYHISPRNVSMDLLNSFQLTGRVDHDITNLVFLMEKGPAPRPDYRNVDPDYQEMRGRPLAGAEAAQDHAREWTVAGHVFDHDTKQLVAKFHVTPGQVDEFNRTAWKTVYAVDGTNGAYQTYFSKRAAQPLLKVEAHGYLPQSITLAAQDSPSVDVYLQKGSGPSGAVLTTNGQPAAGATLVLLTDGQNQAGLNGTALTTYGNPSALQTADGNGYFSFEPSLGMVAVAAASADGFAVMALADFNAHESIRLQPFGEITGALQRPSGPGTNEILDVALSDPMAGSVNLQNTSTTDAQGHFAFYHVPPGHVSISYRQMMPAPNQGWMNQSLADVELSPGQTLATNIIAPARVAQETARNYQQPPPPQRIPGVDIKGIILTPDGQPAADADIALQVPGTYLSIGRGVFNSSNLRDQGLLVTAGSDGSFTLPMFAGAQSIIALNLAGYAQVSLDHLKQSPQVTLQKWARIQGTLRTNHHPGTNEVVTLSPGRSAFMRQRMPGMGLGKPKAGDGPVPLMPPMYDFSAFQAKTDDQGRFELTFVPPGEAVINRQIKLDAHSTTYSPLLTVKVSADETLVTNVGGAGRTVVGKIKLSGDTTLDFKNSFSRLGPPTTKYLEKYNALKTDAERLAYAQSDEAQKVMQANNYSAVVQSDGTFRAEDVLPGSYELGVQPRMNRMPANNEYKMYASAELAVPPPKDDTDDSVVDLGEITIAEHTIHVPTPPAGK